MRGWDERSGQRSERRAENSIKKGITESISNRGPRGGIDPFLKGTILFIYWSREAIGPILSSRIKQPG